MKITPIGRDVAGKFKRLGREQKSRIDDATRAKAEEAKDLHESNVATWRNKPTFVIVRTSTGYDVKTDDEIYAMLDGGTRPHRIEGNPTLAFQNSYVAKTQPGVIGSGSGGASGPMVFAAGVDHPGTAPRRFSQTVLRQINRTLANDIQAAINAGIEAVGL